MPGFHSDPGICRVGEKAYLADLQILLGRRVKMSIYRKNRINWIIFPLTLGLSWMLAGGSAAAFDWDRGKVIDTKSEGSWVSVPFEFLQGSKDELSEIEKGGKHLDWTMPPVTLQDLNAGVKWTRDRGETLLEWRDHHKYPTIATRSVPSDWSAYGGIAITCYSKVATGEKVTLGVLADNPDTPYLDYWCMDVEINWTGRKKLVFPLRRFEKIGEPQNWTSIGGLYFFSKNKGRTPHPATVLDLEDIRLLPGAPDPAEAVPAAQSTMKDDVFFHPESGVGYDAPRECDDHQPELSGNLAPGQALVHNPYFRGARALYQYYPRYTPGFVSVDPQGNACIRALDAIQWLKPDGRWQRTDLTAPILDFCRKNNWAGVAIVDRTEPIVRFDREGDIYVLVQLKRLDQNGNKWADWHDRCSLLLHAKGPDQPWACYKMPCRIAGFEKLDGHNQDALNHPPVIIGSDFGYFPDADQESYLILPEKKPDGSLLIPDKIRIGKSDFERIMAGPVHSGGGNFAITQGDKIYVIYGSIPRTLPENAGSEARAANEAAWRASLQPPTDHPGGKFTYGRGNKERSAVNGVPTYIRVYDRKRKTFSDPVFLGYGGSSHDDHNWGAITADSTGNLHVLIAGHIEPLLYIHTLAAGDISRWSEPVHIPKAPGSGDYILASYPSLNCDKNDMLTCIYRADTGYYNHRIGMVSKNARQEEWSPERSLVVPEGDNYHVWSHRVTYDSVNDRLYLTFCERWAQAVLSRNAYFFCRFIWPQSEVAMAYAPERNPKEKFGPPASGKAMFGMGTGDLVIMTSFDGGRNWRLATTPDFVRGAAHPAGD